MSEQRTKAEPETPHRVLECFARDAGAPEWLLELYRERMGVAMTLYAVEMAQTLEGKP